ncbi:hypothetical protein HZB89_01000 [archaeon]|nr:hypothetical protein [archaeon]
MKAKLSSTQSKESSPAGFTKQKTVSGRAERKEAMVLLTKQRLGSSKEPEEHARMVIEGTHESRKETKFNVSHKRKGYK